MLYNNNIDLYIYIKSAKTKCVLRSLDKMQDNLSQIVVMMYMYIHILLGLLLLAYKVHLSKFSSYQVKDLQHKTVVKNYAAITGTGFLESCLSVTVLLKINCIGGNVCVQE